jgi:hypothetical protein
MANRGDRAHTEGDNSMHGVGARAEEKAMLDAERMLSSYAEMLGYIHWDGPAATHKPTEKRQQGQSEKPDHRQSLIDQIQADSLHPDKNR